MKMPAFLLESKSSDSSNHDGCGGDYVEVSFPSNLSPATGSPDMTSNVGPEGESKLMKSTQGMEEVYFFSTLDNFWKASVGGIHSSATTAPKFGDKSSKTNTGWFPSHNVCQPPSTGFFAPPPKDSCTTTVSPIFSSVPPTTPTSQPSKHPLFGFKPTIERATEVPPAYTSTGNQSHSSNPHQYGTCGGKASEEKRGLSENHICPPPPSWLISSLPKDFCTATVPPTVSSFPSPTPTSQPSNHPWFGFKPTIERATETPLAYTTCTGNHSHSSNPHQCGTCRGKASQYKCCLCNNHVPSPTATPTFVQSCQAESAGEHRCICSKPTGDAAQTIQHLSRMLLDSMFPFIPVVMMPMIPNFNDVPWSTGVGPVPGTTIPPFGAPYRPGVNNMARANYGSIMAPYGLFPMMLPQFTNFNGPATAANGNRASGFVPAVKPNISGLNSPFGNNVLSTSASEPEKAPSSNPIDNAGKETSNPNSYSCKWCMTRGRDLRYRPVYEEATNVTSQSSVILSISALPAVSHLSPEELRWEYQEAHKGIANSLPQCLRQSNSASTCSCPSGNKPNNIPSFSFSKPKDGASTFPSTFSNKPQLGSVFGTCLCGSNLNSGTSPFGTRPSDSAASCFPAFGDNPDKVPSFSFSKPKDGGNPNDSAAICSSPLVNKPNNVTSNIFGEPASLFGGVFEPSLFGSRPSDSATYVPFGSSAYPSSNSSFGKPQDSSNAFASNGTNNE